jgi:hypothetical protein
MKCSLRNICWMAAAIVVFYSCKQAKDKTTEAVKEPEIVANPAPTPTPEVNAPKVALTAQALAGTWNFTENISDQQLRSFLGSEIGDAEYAEMTVTGTQTFLENSTYTSAGKMTILIWNSKSGGEATLRFNYNEKGIWRILGDTLSGTVTGGAYTAADEPTKQVAAESPQLTAALNPVKGETTKLVAISIKPGELVLKDLASGWKNVLTR